jgi:hypothetical protein
VASGNDGREVLFLLGYPELILRFAPLPDEESELAVLIRENDINSERRLQTSIPPANFTREWRSP